MISILGEWWWRKLLGWMHALIPSHSSTSWHATSLIGIDARHARPSGLFVLVQFRHTHDNTQSYSNATLRQSGYTTCQLSVENFLRGHCRLLNCRSFYHAPETVKPAYLYLLEFYQPQKTCQAFFLESVEKNCWHHKNISQIGYHFFTILHCRPQKVKTFCFSVDSHNFTALQTNEFELQVKAVVLLKEPVMISTVTASVAR